MAAELGKETSLARRFNSEPNLGALKILSWDSDLITSFTTLMAGGVGGAPPHSGGLCIPPSLFESSSILKNND